MLTTDLKYDAIRTEFQISGDVDGDRLTRDFASMEETLAAQFERDGIATSSVDYTRAGDLRYVGQGYELRVPIAAGTVGPDALTRLFDDFQDIHRSEYGHVFEDSPIEIVNIRLTGIGAMPKIQLGVLDRSGNSKDAIIETGRCTFRNGDELSSMATPLYARDRLSVGATVAGPAIIAQTDSTTIVPPGATATLDKGGNLIIATGV